MKSKLEQFLNEGKLEEAKKTLEEYKEIQPGDSDILNYESMIAMMEGRNEDALVIAKKALKAMPYMADVHYNYAYACELNGDNLSAIEHYCKARWMALNKVPYSFNVTEVKDHVAELSLDFGDNNIVKGAKNELQTEYLMNREAFAWEVPFSVFHTNYNSLATRYFDYKELNPLFVAYARNNENAMGPESKRVYETKAEMQRVTKGVSEFTYSSDKDFYMSIARTDNLNIKVDDGNKTITIDHDILNQFVNYRFKKGSYKISSEGQFYVGSITPIEHDENRKKVVLNIFVDGLAETVLEKDFENLMPNTYRFFKKGVICKDVHTTGDWTLPSITSALTGQTASNHKVVHPLILRNVDYDTPILFEYFKNAGYNTTKIGGNWRITPTYGFARGMDRVNYAHQYNNYPIESIISDVQEQLYEMRDTDQFIWMELGELHQVADGMNLGACVSELDVMDNETLANSVNSVKQEYDPLRIEYFKKRMQFVDRKLENLYHYLETNYSDDEMIVSLFSDHGQGFLIRPEEEFLSDPRTKVALLVRGAGVSGETDEPISFCDYSAIMCKAAGIDYDYSDTEAHLPVIFGGSDEREFSITETLHVGDAYLIKLNARNYSFYLDTKGTVTDDVRVVMESYETHLYDKEGNEFKDDKLNERLTAFCLNHVAENVQFK